MNKQQYWKERARRYSSFKWAKDSGYLEAFVIAGDFNKKDCVLDVGTGTGLVARAISPLVNMVIGIDTSPEMLAQCQDNGKIRMMYRDARNTKLTSETFHKITARNVFHHITSGAQKAMNECYRLLKEEGRFIVGERIPPSDDVKKEYASIFKLKDERSIFIEEDLVEMLAKAGFRYISTQFYWIKDISIRGWLGQSGLSNYIQEKIFNLHVNGSSVFKQAHNMRIFDGDCLVDIRNIVLVGKK